MRRMILTTSALSMGDDLLQRRDKCVNGNQVARLV